MDTRWYEGNIYKKKDKRKPRVNLIANPVNKSNTWLRTWNWDDPINSKAKKIPAIVFLKKILWKMRKSTWAYFLDLWPESWDLGDPIKGKP
jgi:hypothetical protein